MHLIKLFVLALVFTTISCKKNTTSTENYYVAFKATLSGTNETPPNSSAATGTVLASYNKNTRGLALNVTWTGITATAAHIYSGATNTPVFTFPNLAIPINTSVTLSALQEAELLANLYYVNVHSAAYPNGEIRGQLVRQ